MEIDRHFDWAYDAKVRKDERGLGSAIRRAMSEAVEGDYDLFVNLDADLSHDPEALPSLLTALDDGADMVIGSRVLGGAERGGLGLLLQRPDLAVARRWLAEDDRAADVRMVALYAAYAVHEHHVALFQRDTAPHGRRVV